MIIFPSGLRPTKGIPLWFCSGGLTPIFHYLYDLFIYFWGPCIIFYFWGPLPYIIYFYSLSLSLNIITTTCVSHDSHFPYLLMRFKHWQDSHHYTCVSQGSHFSCLLMRFKTPWKLSTICPTKSTRPKPKIYTSYSSSVICTTLLSLNLSTLISFAIYYRLQSCKSWFFKDIIVFMAISRWGSFEIPLITGE